MLPANPGGLPSLPAISGTPFGNFGPTSLTTVPGSHASTLVAKGLNYRNPNDRMMAITVNVELFNTPTLPERMFTHLQAALVFHLKDVAESVIVMAQQSLVPGHGYVTGRLRDSLIYELADHLLGSGVYYDLFSEVAYYWRWVEFGHWIHGTSSFWPGYHFLETSLRSHESRIRSSVREAWADAMVKLAAEARAPSVGSIL